MLAPQLSSQIDQSSMLKATDIPNSEVPLAGSIKFDGNDFLGYDGSQWKSLTVSNTQPATIVSGENAQRRAGEIRWNGEKFEGYNGRNWIPFTMSLSMTGGMFEFNASTIGYDLSITDSFTFEGIDFNTSKVLIPDLVTNQNYEVWVAHEKGVAVPLVTLSLGYDYQNMLNDSSVRTAKFGDLNGFYIISESLSHMEMQVHSMVKMLTYSCSAMVYADAGNGQFITILVSAPDSWNLEMSLSNIPIDDNRTLVDILPPKAERDEAKRKLRTLIESISIKKIDANNTQNEMTNDESNGENENSSNESSNNPTTPDNQIPSPSTFDPTSPSLTLSVASAGGLEMIWVKPGTFMMGDKDYKSSPPPDPDFFSDEEEYEKNLASHLEFEKYYGERFHQ